MNNSLDQTLLEIERNLGKMQSARQQVNNVTLSSNELAQTVTDLIKEFKKVSNSLHNESGTIGDKLRKTETNFEKKVEELVQKWQKEIDLFLQSIEKVNSKYRNNLEKSIELSGLKAKELQAEHNKTLIQNKETFDSFQITLNEFYENLQQFDFGRYFTPSEQMLKTISQTQNFSQSSIGEVYKKIDAINLPEYVKPIEDKIDRLEKSLEEQKKKTLMFLGIIIILIIISFFK